MTDDRDRIVDLLLQKTHEGHVAWRPRGGPVSGIEQLAEEIYTAKIQSGGGELFVIFRKDPLNYALKGGTPPVSLSLVVKNVKTESEFRIDPDTPVLRKKVQRLWHTIERKQKNAPKDIIEVLEEA